MEVKTDQEAKKLLYHYERDKNKYKVNLTIKEENNFQFLIINEENEYEKYELNLNLSNLIKKSDFFKLCKNSKDFANYMNQLFENKTIFLEKDDNNLEETLVMKWKHNTMFQVEEVIFNLPKIKISLDNKIDLIKKEIDTLKHDFTHELKEKINSLEKRINEIEINYKKEIRTEIEKYFNDLKKKNIFIQESLICTNEKEKKFITEFINMIKPNSKLKLIYRASIDGQMGKDFHSKCDNISPTIVFYKNDIGNKFGGYTQSNWNLTTYGADNNAFIFSINKEKYYKVNNNPNYSIYSAEKRGPNFDGLWVSEPFFKKSNFWENNGDHKCFPKASTYEMSGNTGILLEIEVFQLIS